MPKNIILLSDGTGNSASKLFKTNVWRLYQALDLADPVNPNVRKQIAHYDDGVGTASFKPLAILGGATGWGTKRNVLDLYCFLCRHYEPNDSIYMFGFSRGAFAIRMLTGLISSQGLVYDEKESELRRLAAEAFRAYRQANYPRKTFLTWFFRQLRTLILGLWYFITGRERYKRNAARTKPKITFLGLWDTVAAYGLPIDELTHAWDFVFPLSFPNHILSPLVEHACHAMAIDDERLTFHPEVWDEQGTDGRLQQVWFAGMHSNLGGGYPDDALAGVPLNWILDRADDAGLRFLPDERTTLREMANVNGKKYDSRQGLSGLYRYMPRNIEGLMQKDVDRGYIPKIHESVLRRIVNRVDGYAPIGLPAKYAVVATDGSLQTQEQNPIRPEALQQAEDRKNKQEQIWNLVWWKRTVYFTTVGVFTLLAIFPFIHLPALPYEDRLAVLSTLIGGVGTFLPSMLDKWLASYQQHPGSFLIVALALVGVLAIASRLQDKIFDQMRLVFDKPLPEGETVAEKPTGLVHWLHTNAAPQVISKVFKEHVFPWVILIIIGMFILRGIFVIIDSSGFIPTPTRSELISWLQKGESRTNTFKNDSLCWASGVGVETGKRYKVTLTINEQEPWKDRNTPALASGVEKENVSLPMYLAFPFRRELAEAWFKPIARIGLSGRNDYPLDPACQYPLDPMKGQTSANTIITEINARSTGELFLFVNDAALPVPNAWQVFYANNKGTANITIECLGCDLCPEPGH